MYIRDKEEYDRVIGEYNDILRPREVWFKGTLPFTPVHNQYIYIESGFSSYNSLFLYRYTEFREEFEKMRCEFAYIPMIVANVKSKEYKRYHAPYRKDREKCTLLSNMLNVYLEDEFTVKPSLIVYKRTYFGDYPVSFEDDGAWEYDDGMNTIKIEDKTLCRHKFVLYELPARNVEGSDSIKTFFNTLYKLLDTEYDDGVRYSCTGTIGELGEPYNADWNFEDDVKRLIEEVRERVDKLRAKGVEEMVLQKILAPKVVLSKMRINSRGNIYLTQYEGGYNGMEIEMHPLDKAIYFLFLRHPEGIRFNFLPDYRDELMSIYKTLCDTRTEKEMRDSVYAVTNPCSNSINEKCSRIRQAFIAKIDEQLASHYYINGKRGEPKGIKLDRTMITWEWNVNG